MPILSPTIEATEVLQPRGKKEVKTSLKEPGRGYAGDAATQARGKKVPKVRTCSKKNKNKIV
jgi:hypothetical protein